jgi:cytochrome P450
MRFDPFAPEALDDPYPQYARLRAEDPVHWSEKLRSWVLTRYEDVCAVLRDDVRFSADRSRAARARGRLAAAALAGLRTVSSDPPGCTPVRAILNAALVPRVRAIGPQIETVVARLLDGLAAAGAAGEVDLVEHFAYPLPIAVIADLLGVPDGDRPQFQTLSSAIARGMDRFYTSADASGAMQAIGAYFVQLVQDRRATPDADDLVSRLLAGEHQGDRLSDLEVVAMCTALVFGGHETTVSLIASGLLALLRHPAALERLRAEPALVPTAVEELLRWDSPPQLISRAATTDLALGGRALHAGDSVLLALGAANRDPAAFVDADRLLLDRQPNPHVAFGLGTHVCPGAHLSRLEARAAIPALLARFPRLRLGDGAIVRRPTIVLRGLERLPVRVD